VLTPRGVAHIWTLLARELEQGGRLRVSDGTQQAETAVATATVEDGPELVVTGTFPAGEASFDWLRQVVIAPGGTELDVADDDLGRKAGGSAWGLTVRLRLKATS
jgi:hypothetical protein